MSPPAPLSLRSSLAFRLMVWPAGIFTLVSLAAFAAFYYLIMSGIESRTDQSLLDEIHELATILKEQGVEGVRHELTLVSESVGTGDIFLRLFDAEGNVIAHSDGAKWGHLPGANGNAAKASTMPIFVSVSGTKKHPPARIVFGQIGGSLAVEIAHSTTDDERMAKNFKLLFGVALSVTIAIAFLSAWLAARNAMARVERVTHAAKEIEAGSLNRRVPDVKSGDEISRLASTFNTMLDRLQALVEGMKETNDNIAHELRSPITTMRGAAELALTRNGSREECEAALATTIELSDKLVAIISAMLAISEAEAGLASLTKDEANLSALAREACELFTPLCDEKKQTLKIDAPAPCIARIDAAKIQRVLANLLDNAIKYSPRGGAIVLRVRFRGDSALIDVQDSGPGIPIGEQQKVFDRFYRCDQSRGERGNGLGLSLARAYVRAHGGDIGVSSAASGGSVFTVKFPTALS